EAERPAVIEKAMQANGRLTAEAVRGTIDDRDILRAAKTIRNEIRQARDAKNAASVVIPITLNPINATGRKMRVMVSPDKENCCVVIGPNEAGLRLTPWWKEYQEGTPFKRAMAKAKQLEEEARKLKIKAEEARDAAIERARNLFIEEHGQPIHYAETFDVD